MCRVLIVEDDMAIREGMAKAVRWEQFGCELVGAMASGVDAIGSLERLRPDIIICDIVMPGVDGLAFIEHVQKTNREVCVIMTTGYNDIKFAPQLLKLDILSLLLKPIDFGELTAALKSAVLKTRQRKGAGDVPALAPAQRADELAEHMRDAVEMTGRGAGREDAAPGELVAAAVRWDHTGGQSYDAKHLLPLVENTLPTHNPARVFRYRDTVCAVLAANSATEAEEVYRRWHSRICEGVPGTVSMGLSAPFTTGGVAAYRQACLALDGSFYTGPGSVAVYQKGDGEGVVSDTAAVFFYEALAAHDAPEAKLARLAQATEMLRKAPPQRVRLLVAGSVFRALQAGFETDALLALLEQIMTSGFYSEMLQVLAGALRGGNIALTLGNIQSYIEEHHSQNLRLADLAAAFNYSPSHLSGLIKQETGQNFKDILTQCRIDKAKDMLEANPAMKIHEVARAVGFSDPHHFSSVFKKTVGMPVTDWLQR